LKILHCIHSPKIGGIERLVIELTIAQKKQGLEVYIMLDTRDGQYYEYLVRNEIPVIDSGIKSGFDFSLRKLYSLKKCFKEYDVIHLHSFVLLQALAGMPYHTVYTIHGLSKGIRKENGIKYYLRENLKKYFLNRVNFFVANSDYTLKQAKIHYGLKSVDSKYVYNGVNLPEGIPRNSTNEGDQFIVGLVSRFTRRKRLDRLINAFYIFLKMGGIGKLILVGSGTTFHAIKDLIEMKKISQYVEMPGYRDNVFDYYSKFDICVQPTDNEGFGLVAVEAYLVGKPVLAFSDSGGLKEIIEPIEPENIVNTETDLAERMLFYYYHRDKIAQGASDRIDYARKKFSIERMEREYFDVYDSIMNND